MSEYILETHELTKTYSRKKAVDQLNLKVRKGDIYGFIGKNGAGKTTTIKMVVGLSGATSGSMELFGSANLQEGRKKIGTVIENPAIYPYLSARQNIEVQRIMKGVKDKDITSELLEIVGLENTGKKKAKNFSLGMKQRLAIALALVGNPEFLFLDEPTNGLDPTGIKDIRELIIKLNKEAGITVLISSHILGELSKMATAYGVINNGVLVDQFTVEELASRVKPFVKVVVNNPEKAVSVLKESLEIENIEVSNNTIRIYDKIDKYLEINSVLEQNEIIVQSISKDDGDYEKYFIELMRGGNKNA